MLKGIRYPSLQVLELTAINDPRSMERMSLYLIDNACVHFANA